MLTITKNFPNLARQNYRRDICQTTVMWLIKMTKNDQMTTLGKNFMSKKQDGFPFPNVVCGFVRKCKSSNFEFLDEDFIKEFLKFSNKEIAETSFSWFWSWPFPKQYVWWTREKIRFHQKISDEEAWYKGKSLVKLLADYCWSLESGTKFVSHKKSCVTKLFWSLANAFCVLSSLSWLSKSNKIK